MNAPFKPDAAPNEAPQEAPLWDLSDLYASPTDDRVAADLEAGRKAVAELNALEGQLEAARSDAATLGQRLDTAITAYEQASNHLGALGAYAFLAASTNREDGAAQGFEADIRQKVTTIAAETLWLTLEALAAPGAGQQAP